MVVKVEVWHHEVVEIVRVFHVTLVWPERENDLTVGGLVDVVLLAVSFYLLKQDLMRASLPAQPVTRIPGSDEASSSPVALRRSA
jgi:hypothetical protein